MVFAIPGMSRRFLASAMPIFMRILDRFQFLHPQVRECVRHVSMETTEWMTAFNVYLGVASLFDCLNNWLDAESSPYTSPILAICVECVEGIDQVQQQQQQQELQQGEEEVGSGSKVGTSPSILMGNVKNISRSDHGVVDKEYFKFNADKVRRSAKTQTPEMMKSEEDPLLKESWAYDVLPSASSVLSMALKGVLDWQTEQVGPSDYLPWKLKSEVPLERFSHLDVCKEHHPHGLELPVMTSYCSFHLLLHRFLASIVSECCRYSHHTEALISLSNQLRCLDVKNSSILPQAHDVDSSTGVLIHDTSPTLPFTVTTDGSSGGSTSSNSNSNSSGTDYQLTSLIDFPLRASLFGSQVRVGMWRKNGISMTDQLFNYIDMPYCKVFRDLDILIIQFCAMSYGTRQLIAHIFERYCVIDYVTTNGQKYGTCTYKSNNAKSSNSSSSSSSSNNNCSRSYYSTSPNRMRRGYPHNNDNVSLPVPPPVFGNPPRSSGLRVNESDKEFYPGLLEESLLLLINIVTDIPLPPTSAENALDPLILAAKRFIIHFLAGNNNNNFSTFSQVQENVNVCHAEFVKINPLLLEKIINELADKKKNSPMEPPYFVLKKEMWQYYDPSFPHITSKMHQNASEKRPKPTVSTPICPPPLPCHTIFSSLRQSILFEPILLHCLRNILYAAAAAKTPHSAYLPVRDHWHLKYRGVDLSRALQLLTLAIHLLPQLADNVVPLTSTSPSSTDNSDLGDTVTFDTATTPATTTDAVTAGKHSETKCGLVSTADDNSLAHLSHILVSFLLEEVPVIEESISDEKTNMEVGGVYTGWVLDQSVNSGTKEECPGVSGVRILPHLLWFVILLTFTTHYFAELCSSVYSNLKYYLRFSDISLFHHFSIISIAPYLVIPACQIFLFI